MKIRLVNVFVGLAIRKCAGSRSSVWWVTSNTLDSIYRITRTLFALSSSRSMETLDDDRCAHAG